MATHSEIIKHFTTNNKELRLAHEVLRREVTGEIWDNIKDYLENFYKDEMMDLAGVNPVGPATDPTADPSGEGWLFANNATNVAVLGRQINHDCVQGVTTIFPHVHWRKTTDAAGDVFWRLEYKYADVGGDFTDWAELSTVSQPVPATVDNDTQIRHLLSSFGGLTLDVGLSTKLYFRLSRVPGEALDTYGAAALAMSFDYHYPLRAPGSLEQYAG